MTDSRTADMETRPVEIDAKALVLDRLEAVVDRLFVATTMGTYNAGAAHQTLHAVRFAIQGKEEFRRFPMGEGGVNLTYGEAEGLIQALLPLVEKAQREAKIAVCSHPNARPQSNRWEHCPDCGMSGYRGEEDEDDDDRLMSCRRCDASQWVTGASAIAEGWYFSTDTGWLCPMCAAERVDQSGRSEAES